MEENIQPQMPDLSAQQMQVAAQTQEMTQMPDVSQSNMLTSDNLSSLLSDLQTQGFSGTGLAEAAPSPGSDLLGLPQTEREGWSLGGSGFA